MTKFSFKVGIANCVNDLDSGVLMAPGAPGDIILQD